MERAPKKPFRKNAQVEGIFNRLGFHTGTGERALRALLELEQPSAAPLYDVVAVDVVRCPSRRGNVARECVRPPEPSHKSPLEGLVPSIFLLNAVVPDANDGRDDGPCHAILVTCELSAFAARELTRTAPKNGYGQLNLKTAVASIEHPALRLWAAYCRDARREPANGPAPIRSKFKVMASVVDPSLLPSALRDYDAKPLLVGEPGSLFFHRGYGDVCEFDVDGFALPAEARAGLTAFVPDAGSHVLNLGFGVEARAEAELPECLLGAVQLRHVTAEDAKPFEWWTNFAKPRRMTL